MKSAMDPKIDLTGGHIFQKDSSYVRMLAYLSLVHEEQEVSDNFFVGILENDDGVFFRQVPEEVIKVVRAGGQDDPVGGDRLAVGAGQTDVHQAMGVQQVLK